MVRVEGGYILMYRGGWEISKGSLIASMCIAIILMIVGALVFKEEITMKKAMGAVLCIMGIFLINK